MIKLTALALLAGLATAATVVPSSAQFFAAAVPGGPSNYPVSSQSDDCRDEMSHVRRISAADIQSIHDRSVWLYPVCEKAYLLPRDDYGTLFLDGNANTLRQPIARNQTLMTALRAKGYDQHDVISVVFAAGNSILLYVHQREMR